jgi:hypothetical protein
MLQQHLRPSGGGGACRDPQPCPATCGGPPLLQQQLSQMHSLLLLHLCTRAVRCIMKALMTPLCAYPNPTTCICAAAHTCAAALLCKDTNATSCHVQTLAPTPQCVQLASHKG